MENKFNNIEILSPAGSVESVRAAVLNGANAVYLGQASFNARQNATNFSTQELKDAVAFCHLNGVKVYQTLNVLVFDDEIDELLKTIKVAVDVNVDALIVQDLGVLSIVKKVCPDMKINASTQMTVHSVEGAKLLKSLGFSRVVLSRELTLAQIKDIVDNVDIEVEVFIHGALCMSVSGQCYMSSMIGGRSGNKGSCAGTCRLPFTSTGDKGAYDLSLKDLCSTDVFEELVNIGVTSVKIEGRMKRPEYVAIATKSYADLKFGIAPPVDKLKAVFSRSGFTNGYLENKIDADMFGFRQKDDVIASTKELLGEWKESYHKQKPFVGLDFKFKAVCGQECYLTVMQSDNSDISVTVTGDVCEKAINKPTTPQMIEESLAKVGGTIYFVENIEIEAEEGIIIPKSKLNLLRRTAIDLMDAKRIQRPVKTFIPTQIKPSQLELRDICEMKFRARISNINQLSKTLFSELEYIYIPFEQIIKSEAIISTLTTSEKNKIVVEVDRVMFGSEDYIKKSLEKIKSAGFKNLWVSNLAHIQIAKDLDFEMFGSMFLNITNSQSLGEYVELGVSDALLSIENTVADIQKINTSKPVNVGAVIYGYLPLMVVRNCPIKPHYDCGDCKGEKYLTDRLGNEFKVRCTNKRYSEILNCRKLELSDRLNEFNRCDFGLLYFTDESSSDILSVVQRYKTKAKVSGEFTRGLYYRGIR